MHVLTLLFQESEVIGLVTSSLYWDLLFGSRKSLTTLKAGTRETISGQGWLQISALIPAGCTGKHLSVFRGIQTPASAAAAVLTLRV